MGKMILNGKEYAGSGSEWHEYSTSEKVVGKWIDGKPIYEKTINLSESDFTKSNNWHWQYNYENDISNYKEVIKIEGIMQVSWNTYKHIIVLGADDYEGNNNTSNYLSFVNYYRNIALKGYPYNNASSKLTNVTINFCQLTLQYTKTTD